LPSLPPSYLYTFVAMVAVAGLLVSSFIAYANAIRSSSETRQLKTLMDQVAAEGTQLVTLTLTTNATSERFVQMPARIGNRQYWFRLCNNSDSAWLEGGFGSTATENTDLRVNLPREAAATGQYTGGHGAAHLSCAASDGLPHLQLENSDEGN
jgi:hypothetical protein